MSMNHRWHDRGSIIVSDRHYPGLWSLGYFGLENPNSLLVMGLSYASYCANEGLYWRVPQWRFIFEDQNATCKCNSYLKFGFRGFRTMPEKQSRRFSLGAFKNSIILERIQSIFLWEHNFSLAFARLHCIPSPSLFLEAISYMRKTLCARFRHVLKL